MRAGTRPDPEIIDGNNRPTRNKERPPQLNPWLSYLHFETWKRFMYERLEELGVLVRIAVGGYAINNLDA
jgi:hypothetical protein